MEGEKKDRYKLPYNNTQPEEKDIIENISNLSIKKEEEKKKWVEKEEEKKQKINYEDPEVQKNLPLWLQKSPGEENQTPLWKRILAELESPFIN